MGEFIQGLDILDFIQYVEKKNKRYQAIFLQGLEEELGKDSQSYIVARKLFLDCFNNYTRSIFRVIFGNDFESINHKN